MKIQLEQIKNSMKQKTDISLFDEEIGSLTRVINELAASGTAANSESRNEMMQRIGLQMEKRNQRTGGSLSQEQKE